MALDFYEGFYVEKTHPDPEEDPIEMPLLDQAWAVNEKMVAEVDEVFNDIPHWSVTRYNASKVKRAPAVPLKSFDTTDTTTILGTVTLTLPGTIVSISTVTTSEEDRFGLFKLRQTMSNKPTTDLVDIFQFSDSRLKNGLKADALKNEDGDPVDVYKKKDFLVRNWLYQEVTENMGWVLLHLDAFWDVGPLFKLGCGVYHSTWPQPPPGGLYAFGTPINFVGTVVPVGFLVEGYWNVYYNFELGRYGIDIPGGGSAIIHKIFEGPGFKRPKPHMYDIVTINEYVPLVGQSPLFPDRHYNCGTIRWQSVWQTVPPELAPFILWDCPYS
jgi:hypothetical protein